MTDVTRGYRRPVTPLDDLLALAHDDLAAATRSYEQGARDLITETHMRLLFAQTQALLVIARCLSDDRLPRDRSSLAAH